MPEYVGIRPLSTGRHLRTKPYPTKAEAREAIDALSKKYDEGTMYAEHGIRVVGRPKVLRYA